MGKASEVRDTILRVIQGGRGKKPFKQVIKEGQDRVKTPQQKYAPERKLKSSGNYTPENVIGTAALAGIPVAGVYLAYHKKPARKKK